MYFLNTLTISSVAFQSVLTLHSDVAFADVRRGNVTPWPLISRGVDIVPISGIIIRKRLIYSPRGRRF